MKAVSLVDDQRAILMAAVLAYEQIDELQSRIAALNPAQDVLISLDHGSAQYQLTIAAVDRLIVVVKENNFYRELEPLDHERRLGELEAGRRLLGSRTVSRATLKAALVAVVTYLALKFVDAPIGEAATAAWEAIKSLFGF